MSNNANLRDALRNYVCDLRWLEPNELADTTTLLSSNLIDSLDLMELVAFVEKQAGISVHPGELAGDNWDSVAKILAFVARKHSTPT
jgi:acyl carrier protein